MLNVVAPQFMLLPSGLLFSHESFSILSFQPSNGSNGSGGSNSGGQGQVTIL
jgi:hypothetical protein